MENNKKPTRKVYGKPAVRSSPSRGQIKNAKQGERPVDKATVNTVRRGNTESDAALKTVGASNENEKNSFEKISVNKDVKTQPAENENVKESPRGDIVDAGQGVIEAKLKESGIHEFFTRNAEAETRIIHRAGVDIPMLMIFIFLVSFGLIMVFSASYAYSYNKFGNSYDFILDQLLYVIVGLAVVGIITVFYDYFMNKKMIRFLIVMYFLFLCFLLVLVIFIGTSEDEAQRWLSIMGINIQPSEFMKGGLILLLAMYYSMYNEAIKKGRWYKSFLMGTVIPMIPVGAVVLLVFFENHTSGMIILLAIGVMMVLMGEKNHWFIGIIGVAGIVAVVYFINYLMTVDPETAPEWANKITSKYAWKRIEIWLNPENFDLKQDLWQTAQGLYAIGSGGFMGVGFGQSRQKHMFVSQPQNDFIYTIICEELGFVGGVAVIALFLMLAWRGYVIGKRIPDRFSRYTVWGLSFSITMQAFLNIGVVTNLIPNTGISLPFFSYGGSSIMSMMIEMGFILALSRYAVQPARR